MYNRKNTFFVKRNSSLPVIKFPVTQGLMEEYDFTEDMFDNVAVTFSMVNTETGLYKIANAPGTLKLVKNNYEFQDETVFTLEYYLTQKNTNEIGIFEGEFKLSFLGDNCGIITLPSDEKLTVVVKPSITKVDVVDANTPVPTPPTLPSIPPYFFGIVSSNNAAAGSNRPSATANLVKNGTQVNLPSTGTISIDWNSDFDDYVWFAIPSSSTSKTIWYVNSFNTSDIGGAVTPGGNLFPSPDLVTVNITNPLLGNLEYEVYISNYQVEIRETVQLRNS